VDPSYILTSYVSKGKVVPVHAMKVYGGMNVKLHTFLISALDEAGWSGSRPGHFTAGKELTVRLNRILAGATASLDVLQNRRIPCTCHESNHTFSVVRAVTLSTYRPPYVGSFLLIKIYLNINLPPMPNPFTSLGPRKVQNRSPLAVVNMRYTLMVGMDDIIFHIFVHNFMQPTLKH
jgi:hypothetical protein